MNDLLNAQFVYHPLHFIGRASLNSASPFPIAETLRARVVLCHARVVWSLQKFFQEFVILFWWRSSPAVVLVLYGLKSEFEPSTSRRIFLFFSFSSWVTRAPGRFWWISSPYSDIFSEKAFARLGAFFLGMGRLLDIGRLLERENVLGHLLSTVVW